MKQFPYICSMKYLKSRFSPKIPPNSLNKISSFANWATPEDEYLKIKPSIQNLKIGRIINEKKRMAEDVIPREILNMFYDIVPIELKKM